MRTYTDATAMLNGRTSRKIENHTYLQQRDATTIVVKLHATDIVTFKSNGDVILNTGGWKTITTKDRLNKFSPISISQRNGVWLFTWNEQEHTFADGMTIKRTGKLVGCGQSEDAQRKQRATVRKYAAEFVSALVAGKIPQPSNGDCWYCMMREVKTRKPLGEVTRDKSHIESHIEEKYFVPSLLLNAMQASGCGPIYFSELNAFWQENWNADGAETTRNYALSFMPKQWKRFLTRYLYSQLGMAR